MAPNNSTNSTAGSNNRVTPPYSIGTIARRELRTILRQTTDPGVTITNFQKSHSLHAMLARAFHTTTTAAATAATNTTAQESLDTDSILVFLHHLGITQYQVHKRIATVLTTQLEDTIRKSSRDSLLLLVKKCWPYSTVISELRPVLQACLKQLGTDIPLPVLLRLAERSENVEGATTMNTTTTSSSNSSNSGMKYADIWHPLPPLVKRLVWEADWEHYTTTTRSSDEEDNIMSNHNLLLQKTLFAQQIIPLVQQYCEVPYLVDASNKMFVSSLRERRLLTTQRRAVSADSQPQQQPVLMTMMEAAKAVSELKILLSNGDTPAYRPKLLNAMFTILMNAHVNHLDTATSSISTITTCSSGLLCTLVADILLSGPLPKAYQPVLALARLLDETVKEGAVSNLHISQIQQALTQIFPTTDMDSDTANEVNNSSTNTVSNNTDTEASLSKRILPTIIKESIQAMRDADPQSLFLNPVTDAIAPGYSKVITRPMCMKQMETTKYISLQDFDADVKLMFQNCINYNVGNAGQWFRGEARRQHTVFKNDIFPQAKKFFETSLQAIQPPPLTTTTTKRKVGDTEMVPLAQVPAKKQKLDPTLPSLPALATMLLADPFVVRLLLDRLLRSLRIDAVKGDTIPVAHRAIPSLLQLLHLSYSSTKMISERIYFVPDAGFEKNEEDLLPYEALRRYTPLVLKLCVEAELDKRLASDLAAAATMALLDTSPTPKLWNRTKALPKVPSLVLQGALVHLCQPGNTYESSLAVTFPKFAIPLRHCQDRPFFVSLIAALIRHKSKLGKTNRDAICKCWLQQWISNNLVGHECFVMLLNEWASMGNLLLTRDLLLQYSKDAVKKLNDFGTIWNQESGIREQYEILLKGLPESYATEWKKEMGVEQKVLIEPKENEEETLE